MERFETERERERWADKMFQHQKIPSRDPRIGRYSKNLKFYVKIHGRSSLTPFHRFIHEY